MHTCMVVRPVASANSRFSLGDGYALCAYHSRRIERDFSWNDWNEKWFLEEICGFILFCNWLFFWGDFFHQPIRLILNLVFVRSTIVEWHKSLIKTWNSPPKVKINENISHGILWLVQDVFYYCETFNPLVTFSKCTAKYRGMKCGSL